MSFDEFKQAIWEDIKKLEENGVEYVAEAKMYVPVVNKYGNPLRLRGYDGKLVKSWPSYGHHSATWDYKL